MSTGIAQQQRELGGKPLSCYAEVDIGGGCWFEVMEQVVVVVNRKKLTVAVRGGFFRNMDPAVGIYCRSTAVVHNRTKTSN